MNLYYLRIVPTNGQALYVCRRDDPNPTGASAKSTKLPPSMDWGLTPSLHASALFEELDVARGAWSLLARVWADLPGWRRLSLRKARTEESLTAPFSHVSVRLIDEDGTEEVIEDIALHLVDRIGELDGKVGQPDLGLGQPTDQRDRVG